MQIRRNQLGMRVLGVCLGIGLLALGLVAMVGAERPGAAVGDRALGFGLALVVAGVAAIVGSLTVADPSRIW